jgi:hypothetical protein
MPPPWEAELTLGDGFGRIYIVKPTGLTEDAPNLTDKSTWAIRRSHTAPGCAALAGHLFLIFGVDDKPAPAALSRSAVRLVIESLRAC